MQAKQQPVLEIVLNYGLPNVHNDRGIHIKRLFKE
jgi:hypothetical protein